MSAYRFRVKLEWDPTSLWRDIVVGEDRTLAEFQTVINETMGLNQEHLWFFGRVAKSFRLCSPASKTSAE